MAKKVTVETAVATAAIQDKFWVVRTELNNSLIERADEIDMILTAMIGGFHPLLVGPPGAAKSMLADAVCQWINGNLFSIQFNKFTKPEEVFGPLDIPALQQSRYRRIVDGYLPWCHIASLDEIWKASSAILNTLLWALNERKFRNDGQVTQIPLIMALAASNEWPQGEELGALFDRFLLRKTVRTIGSAAGRAKLLWTPDLTPKLSDTITPAEIEQARTESKNLPITQATERAMDRILAQLQSEGIEPGDRRKRLSVRVSQAYAYLCKATQVDPEHLEILQHTLWNDPADQPQKAADIVTKIANPQGSQIKQFLLESQTIADEPANDLIKANEKSKKLQEIRRKLNAMKDSDKKTMALQFVEQAMSENKLKALTYMDDVEEQ